MEQRPVEASDEAEVDRLERRQQQRVLKGGIGGSVKTGATGWPKSNSARARVPQICQPSDSSSGLTAKSRAAGTTKAAATAEHRERGEAARRRPPEAQRCACGQAAKPERQRGRREHRQRDPADRHVDDREIGGENPGRGQADCVAERQPGEQLTPGPGEPQQRQQPAAEHEHQHVRGDEREDVGRHGALIRET